MKTIIVTGSGGLIGCETCEFYLKQGYTVIGIDNNMRQSFFGNDGSVKNNIELLKLNKNYIHCSIDIRDFNLLKENIFKLYENNVLSIIHCAAQPSHDWAVTDPFTDFNINTSATLNLLELYKQFCPSAVFIFMSTNKVYGDNPNYLPLIELDTRWELREDNEYYNGVTETFSTDNTKHSLFGCSKLSADIYVQEYGKYFNLKTTVFRGGCLTGSKHNSSELHGFLNYLVKCNLTKKNYNIFGYKGKQVRDNIHSKDLVSAFDCIIKNPKCGEVYNIGGGRYSNCSILEAITEIESISNIKSVTTYINTNRIGDHIWWISDTSKFRKDYPDWIQTYTLNKILKEIVENIKI